jgi:hypothetical protein
MALRGLIALTQRNQSFSAISASTAAEVATQFPHALLQRLHAFRDGGMIGCVEPPPTFLSGVRGATRPGGEREGRSRLAEMRPTHITHTQRCTLHAKPYATPFSHAALRDAARFPALRDHKIARIARPSRVMPVSICAGLG